MENTYVGWIKYRQQGFINILGVLIKTQEEDNHWKAVLSVSISSDYLQNPIPNTVVGFDTNS